MSQKRQQEIKNITLFSLLTNIGVTIIMWFAGIFGNSYALIANAIESTNDIIASIAVFLGLRYAQKPANEQYPYGRGRIEPIVTFFVVFIMIVSAIYITFEAYQRILTPHSLPKKWTLLVLAVFLIWKELSYRIVIRKSIALNSSALKAEAWHHRSDALTDLAALIGISFALILGEGYEFLDDVAAIIASIIIVYNAFRIFQPAWGEIMDKNTYKGFKQLLIEDAKSIEEIILIEQCHIRKVGIYYYIDMHVEVDGNMTVRKGHDICHQFKALLMDKYEEIGDILIHIEPAKEE